ncbi:MAG: tetratricopeptide repeat protein [Phormidesmis sp.]
MGFVVCCCYPLLYRFTTVLRSFLSTHSCNKANTCYRLANACRHQSNYGKAEPLFQQALSILRQHYGVPHPHTQAVHNDLMEMIVTAIEAGRFAELSAELPPLDLNNLSELYSWAKPAWERGR